MTRIRAQLRGWLRRWRLGDEPDAQSHVDSELPGWRLRVFRAVAKADRTLERRARLDAAALDARHELERRRK